ncbi:sensor histidine kinase [Fodinibius halophilus]|uniref:histidine kinase n=1 Tax=Fodinibius halophilus TaxID=1736908 RepID=A0A6M1TAB8_9BACT|nr:histidine kinase dimerization/phosphoacceptor domain -containing protein [Fodinibius halophilus]NGP89403.1 PAS domain-containing protein [Fodinibius halophilus]
MAEDIFKNIRNNQLTEDLFQSVDQRIAKTLIQAIQTTKEMVVVTDAPDKIGDEKIVFVNKAFEEITQYSREEVIGKSLSILQGPKTDKETIKELVEKVSKGEHFEGETFNYKKDGSTYRVRWSIDPIRDEDGEITHYVSVQRNVTKEWEQRQQMKDIIEEREMLIKETHHRIKNNLATITGMLELQVMKSSSQEVQEVLSESMNRVQSIASIHEKLYETEGLASITLDDYLEDLIRQVDSSIENIDGLSEIDFEIDIKPISIRTRQAVPLGLIINELVTNSHKHAFDEEGGTISIKCTEENNTVSLEVKDDGKGLPEGLDVTSSQSLGLKLVDSLAKQLKAEYSFSSDNGTQFTMTFEKEY